MYKLIQMVEGRDIDLSEIIKRYENLKNTIILTDYDWRHCSKLWIFTKGLTPPLTFDQ